MLIKTIFISFVYQPIVNLLFGFYLLTFRDLGLAIIALTVFINLILLPISRKNFRTQKIMQVIQPEVQEIQKKYKEDPTKQYQATMDLYKEHKISPFSGFLFMFLQLLILIPLYRIFLGVFQPGIRSYLYPFLSSVGQPGAVAFGLLNLQQPNILLVVVTAVLQYFQAKLTMAGNSKNSSTIQNPAKNLVYLGPIITVLVFSRLPSAVVLYWCTASLFNILILLALTKKEKQNDRKLGNISK